MNWNSTGTNPQAVEAFNDYRELLMRVATLYAGARLIESADLSALGDDNFKLSLSNNFPEEATTIRSIGDLKRGIASGEYGQMALKMSVIQLCTAFEILFDRLCSIYGCTISNNAHFDVPYTPPFGAAPTVITLGNRTLNQIRKLHQTLSVTSAINNDGPLLKLAAIIEARNCLTHAGGIVQQEKQRLRLKIYGIASEIGKPLMLDDNLFDDFLQYMASHALAFVNKAP
ncbi:hypothetical protein ACS5PK_02485 [Roseateles sp. DB2]|uniref:hypothetical protein n=1 Tax=Roseateles sp. DB2 TaxID=3453717 RepID=UPI003EED9002